LRALPVSTIYVKSKILQNVDVIVTSYKKLVNSSIRTAVDNDGVLDKVTSHNDIFDAFRRIEIL